MVAGAGFARDRRGPKAGGYGDQTRALLWLRFTLSLRRIARRREWGRLVLSILSVLLALAVSCGVAAAVWGKAVELQHAPGRVEARGGAAKLAAIQSLRATGKAVSPALAKSVSLHLEGKRKEALRELNTAIENGEETPEVFAAKGHIQFGVTGTGGGFFTCGVE